MPTRQAHNSALAGTSDTVGVLVNSFAVGETALALIVWYGTQTITSVTLTGESNMTVLGSPQTGTMFQDGRCQWAILDSVTAAGNKTATVLLSGTSNAVKIDLWRWSSAASHGTPVGANGNSGTLSVNLTTTVANAAIVAGGISDAGTWTPSAVYTKETAGADSYQFDGSMYDADAGAVGSKTVDATASSGQWVWSAIELYAGAPPDPATGITVNTLRPRAFAPGIAR